MRVQLWHSSGYNVSLWQQMHRKRLAWEEERNQSSMRKLYTDADKLEEVDLRSLKDSEEVDLLTPLWGAPLHAQLHTEAFHSSINSAQDLGIDPKPDDNTIRVDNR